MKFFSLLKGSIFAITICLAISCTTGTANKNSKESEKTKVSSNKEFTLPLDSETPIWNYFSQTATINGKQKLIWFNPTRYSIDYFDIESQSLDRSTVLELNGPNAIPGVGMNSGIKYVNEDTVIIYSGPLKRFTLTNASGKIYKKINLKDYNYGLGSTDFKSAICYRKGSVYMQRLPKYPKNLPENYNPPYNKIAKVDLSDGTVEEFEIPYPDIYSNIEIPQQLKMMNFIYNQDIDKFIISYPLSDQLYVTDFHNKTVTYTAKSNILSTTVPVDFENNIVPSTSLQSFYYWRNDSYEALIYDSTNKVYLREARKGISEEDFMNRKFSSKREIIILDKNFKQIDKIEYTSSGLNYYFFYDDKFYWEKDLQKYNLQDGVEDYIYFQNKALAF